MAGSAAVAGHAAKTRKKKESQFSLVMKRLRKNKLAMAGLVIILILFVVALLAPWIMPYAYDEMNMLERFSGPSFAHLCGTDEMGRDIFSRLLYGARASLSLGFLATIISTVIGMFIGSIVGYFEYPFLDRLDQLDPFFHKGTVLAEDLLLEFAGLLFPGENQVLPGLS